MIPSSLGGSRGPLTFCPPTFFSLRIWKQHQRLTLQTFRPSIFLSMPYIEDPRPITPLTVFSYDIRSPFCACVSTKLSSLTSLCLFYYPHVSFPRTFIQLNFLETILCAISKKTFPFLQLPVSQCLTVLSRVPQFLAFIAKTSIGTESHFILR